MHRIPFFRPQTSSSKKSHLFSSLLFLSATTICIFSSSARFTTTNYSTTLHADSAPQHPSLTQFSTDATPYQIKNALDDIYYHFDENGVLRDQNNAPFQFRNQRQYDATGDSVQQYVIDQLLRKQRNFQEIVLPLHDAPAHSKIYYRENQGSDKLLMLVQGSGVVRPGLWARAIVLNDQESGILAGTMLPQIDEAIEEGYSILILNPNENQMSGVRVEENETPEKHVQYVWRNLIEDNHLSHAGRQTPHSTSLPTSNNYKYVAIIAHSYGGKAVMDLLTSPNYQVSTREKVFAVALTDSVHNQFYMHHPLRRSDESPMLKQWQEQQDQDFFYDKCVNWMASSQPLDTELQGTHQGITGKFREYCRLRSAGHTKHSYTTWSAHESMMQFIREKLQEAQQERGASSLRHAGDEL